MQRIANPWTSVRLRDAPPFYKEFLILIMSVSTQELRALVVELVDTRDLKSLDVRVVPVQVRPGAPSIRKAYREVSLFSFLLSKLLSKQLKNQCFPYFPFSLLLAGLVISV